MTNRITATDAPKGDMKRPTSTAPLAPAPKAPAKQPSAGSDAFVRQASSATVAAAAGLTPPSWNFFAQRVKTFYDASKDRTNAYNFPEILKDVPAMWKRPVQLDIRPTYKAAATTIQSSESYGELFKRVGLELGVDPYALATYCVFESYNSAKGSYNPHMREVAGGMHAAGIAATQAQDWKGRKIPGTDKTFPKTLEATAKLLRANPEYGVRCLAAELKHWYDATGQDLAKAFPKTAYPAWGSPDKSRGNYGTQAQYVSRAFALYEQFKKADH